MNYTYTVNIINRNTGEAVKQIETCGINKASKVKRGVEINLDHELYFVNITRND